MEHSTVTSLNQTDYEDDGTQQTNKTRSKGFAIRPLETPEKVNGSSSSSLLKENPSQPPPPRNEATLAQNETQSSITEGLINHLFNFPQTSPPNTTNSQIQQQDENEIHEKTNSSGKIKPPKKGFYSPSSYKHDANKTESSNQTATVQQSISNKQNETSINQGDNTQQQQKTPKILYLPVAVMAKFNNKGNSKKLSRNGKNAFPIHESKLLKHHVSSFHHHNNKNKYNNDNKNKNKKKAAKWKKKNKNKKKHGRKYKKRQHQTSKKQQHGIKKHRSNKWRKAAHKKTQVNGQGQMQHQTKIFNQKHRHPMDGHRYGGEMYQHTHKMAAHDFSKQVGHYGVHDDNSDNHANTDRFAEISPNSTESDRRKTLGGETASVAGEAATMVNMPSDDQKLATILGRSHKVDDTTIVNKINQFTSLAEHLADNLSNFNRGRGWKPKQDPDWKEFLQSREHLKDIEVGKL